MMTDGHEPPRRLGTRQGAADYRQFALHRSGGGAFAEDGDSFSSSPPSSFFPFSFARSAHTKGRNAKKTAKTREKTEKKTKKKKTPDKKRGGAPRALIAVISHRRPENVGRMQAMLPTGSGWPVVWVVGRGETAAYRRAGARDVIEGGALCRSRNLAIEEARKRRLRYVVQVSDDVRAIKRLRPNGSTAAVDVRTAAARLIAAMGPTPYRLGGVHPVLHPRWAAARAPHTTLNFVVGDFIVVDTRSEVRFDEKLEVKEDYDFTIAHVKAHGGALRDNRLMILADHRSNPGGAVSRDRPKREKAAIARMKRKWPGVLRDNPRRPGEVLINKGALGALAHEDAHK